MDQAYSLTWQDLLLLHFFAHTIPSVQNTFPSLSSWPTHIFLQIPSSVFSCESPRGGRLKCSFLCSATIPLYMQLLLKQTAIIYLYIYFPPRLIDVQGQKPCIFIYIFQVPEAESSTIQFIT